MTTAELKLLRRLLNAIKDANPWVEVGTPAGISMRTVNTFCERGLIWTEGRNVRQTWARLRTGDEIPWE